MTTENSAIEEAIINGGHCEREDIRESFLSQIRRHIDWNEDTIKARLDREFGKPTTHKNYKRIRHEAMKRIAHTMLILSKRITKAAEKGETTI